MRVEQKWSFFSQISSLFCKFGGQFERSWSYQVGNKVNMNWHSGKQKCLLYSHLQEIDFVSGHLPKTWAQQFCETLVLILPTGETALTCPGSLCASTEPSTGCLLFAVFCLWRRSGYSFLVSLIYEPEILPSNQLVLSNVNYCVTRSSFNYSFIINP